jgi:hypothetical protein
MGEHSKKPFDGGHEGAPGGSEPRKEYLGSDVLGRSSPEAVFEGLRDRDPLHVRERCMTRLSEQAQLLPLDRLVTMTMAAVAHTASHYHGEPELDDWLLERIDASIVALHVQEREFERMGLPPMDPFDTHCVFLAEALGIDRALTRRACIVFNQLPLGQREVFWALVVERRSIADYLSQVSRSRQDIMQSLRAAIEALSGLGDSDFQWEKKGGDA